MKHSKWEIKFQNQEVGDGRATETKWEMEDRQKKWEKIPKQSGRWEEEP